ncbi:DUF6266 family protein [Pedobacter gandavensis]|uniref:DUF6266 family protein n=1 Tax=Pedobacter gandavensis TaxID=2679963 RepID=UPI002930BE8D|nr:DUF6266 family protein [Pedobacter gandavensis]
MAIIAQTILGVPNGKIGSLVFYQRKGKTICRKIGDPGPQSPLQLANCQAMAVTTKLLSSMLKFINLGFALQVQGTDKSPHNLATAYHKKHALKGLYPDIQVDYSKVILSQGDLSQISDLKLQKTATGLQFNWDPKLNYKKEEYDDQLMILLYYPIKKKADEFLNAAKRCDGQHFIELYEEELLAPIAVYASLRSADGTGISNSIYLGTLNEQEVLPTIPLEREQEILSEKKLKNKGKAKISDLEFRFIHTQSSYLQQLEEIKTGKRIEDKAFEELEADYLMLKSRIHTMKRAGNT